MKMIWCRITFSKMAWGQTYNQPSFLTIKTEKYTLNPTMLTLHNKKEYQAIETHQRWNLLISRLIKVPCLKTKIDVQSFKSSN